MRDRNTQELVHDLLELYRGTSTRNRISGTKIVHLTSQEQNRLQEEFEKSTEKLRKNRLKKYTQEIVNKINTNLSEETSKEVLQESFPDIVYYLLSHFLIPYTIPFLKDDIRQVTDKFLEKWGTVLEDIYKNNKNLTSYGSMKEENYREEYCQNLNSVDRVQLLNDYNRILLIFPRIDEHKLRRGTIYIICKILDKMKDIELKKYESGYWAGYFRQGQDRIVSFLLGHFILKYDFLDSLNLHEKLIWDIFYAHWGSKLTNVIRTEYLNLDMNIKINHNTPLGFILLQTYTRYFVSNRDGIVRSDELVRGGKWYDYMDNMDDTAEQSAIKIACDNANNIISQLLPCSSLNDSTNSPCEKRYYEDDNGAFKKYKTSNDGKCIKSDELCNNNYLVREDIQIEFDSIYNEGMDKLLVVKEESKDKEESNILNRLLKFAQSHPSWWSEGARLLQKDS
tara:strand:+ start:1384 stop:2739 length:1356 start_codon:yes stop_codon:yes gene_type:complete